LLERVGTVCWLLSAFVWAGVLALPGSNGPLAAGGFLSSILLPLLLRKRWPQLVPGAGAGAFGLALDQLIKAWATAYWTTGPGVEVVPGLFRLTYAQNPGAILGLFPGHRVTFIVTGVATGLVIWAYYRMTGPREGLVRACLWVVLAGTLGNTVDRWFLGHVVDLFEISLAGQVLTVFNLADLLSDVSVLIIAVDVVWNGTGDEDEAQTE